MPGESVPKTTAMKGCTTKGSLSSSVLGGEKKHSFVVLFCFCFYSLNPEHRTFQLQTLTESFGAPGRHRLEVPEERLGREAEQGDVVRNPTLGLS